MFKFKMLRKVLVAVFFCSLIIELNLNLCIALSIDLSTQSHQIEPGKATNCFIEPTLELEGQMGADDQKRLAGSSFAGRTQQAASSSTSTIQMQPTAAARDEANSVAQSSQSRASSQGNSIDLAAASRTVASQTTGSLKVPIIQKLESNGRNNYFGRILVGEQQVPFYVLFDLSSARFWLPSSKCESSSCLGRRRFDGNESASYQPDELQRRMDVTYDRGLSYKGQVVKDSVRFAGVTVEQQEFGAISELQGELLDHLPVDGFLGLGFKDISDNKTESSNETSADASALLTPVERLWRMGVLKEPIFSMHIRADVDQYSYSNDNGELILGELAADYKQEELTYVPVTSGNFWEFHLSGIALRSSHGVHDLEHGCEFACPVVLDTRYAFIGGHFSDVDRINRAMGAYPVGKGIYRLATCDLGILPYLVLQIGGKDFLLAPNEYVDIRRIRGQAHTCYSALVVIKSEDYPFWILGEFFLKRHYVVFDYGQKRLGFARSKSMTDELGVDQYGRIKRLMHRSDQ